MGQCTLATLAHNARARAGQPRSWVEHIKDTVLFNNAFELHYCNGYTAITQTSIANSHVFINSSDYDHNKPSREPGRVMLPLPGVGGTSDPDA